jgi:type IV secretory pathway TrbF-like protein
MKINDVINQALNSPLEDRKEDSTQITRNDLEKFVNEYGLIPNNPELLQKAINGYDLLNVKPKEKNTWIINMYRKLGGGSEFKKGKKE